MLVNKAQKEPTKDEKPTLGSHSATWYGGVGGITGSVFILIGLIVLGGGDMFIGGDWRTTIVLLLVVATSGLAGAGYGYKYQKRAGIFGFIIGCLLFVPVLNVLVAITNILSRIFQ